MENYRDHVMHVQLDNLYNLPTCIVLLFLYLSFKMYSIIIIF